MLWNDIKDLIMLREVAARGIMRMREKSRERGAAWQSLAENLSPILAYELTARSVRDHFKSLVNKFKGDMAKEKRATGGGGDELDEKWQLLEELIELNEDVGRQVADEVEKRQAEKELAQDMRAVALERFSETRKRKEGKDEGDEDDGSKKRRKSREVMDWLKEKVEYEKSVREKEIEDRRREREQEAGRHQEFLEVIATTQQQVSFQMQQQNEQHQQQFAMLQQQMMMFMQQQQQQTELIANILKDKHRL